jgi:hypothetical protein
MEIKNHLRDLKNLDPLSIDHKILQALHLVTRDRKLNQDAARKLKQIFHLFNQITPLLEKSFELSPHPAFMDLGCGKAYLGFLLSELLLKKVGAGKLIGVESRSDLTETCNKIVEHLEFKNVEFLNSTIEKVSAENVTMLMALHACDTATNDAIALGLKHEVPLLVLVPCCQAEIARELHELPKSETWPLWRHGVFEREFGSHLTNVLRCLVLESHGYKITVTEFTGWEHSLKNQLIMAEKIQKQNSLARKQLSDLMSRIPVLPRKLKTFITNE